MFSTTFKLFKLLKTGLQNNIWLLMMFCQLLISTQNPDDIPLNRGSPTPGLQISIGPRPVRNWVAQQEVSGE